MQSAGAAPGNGCEDTEILRFQIETSEAELQDLHRRILSTRWPDELPGAGWSHGVPLVYLKDLAGYWATAYDWRKHEARLNSIPQFTTTIDGQNIHFLHVRSTEPGAVPLMLVHGWPGSVVEFLDVIGPLTNPGAHGADSAQAFHVVIPSLPGYGFSGPTSVAGWNNQRIARAFAELMRRLGYHRYGVQGGDWGAMVAPQMGREDSDHVLGVHVNAATFGFVPFGPLGPEELAALTDSERTRIERLGASTGGPGNGYFEIQAQRPQTLAYGLTDSPVGQLAWIVEKFWEWAHGSGLPDDTIGRERMLTNVMMYWLTGTANSSSRLYYENMHAHIWNMDRATSPTGVAVFATDFAIRRYAELGNNIVHWSEFDRGGHFAAMEAPDLLVGDIRKFFGTLR